MALQPSRSFFILRHGLPFDLRSLQHPAAARDSWSVDVTGKVKVAGGTEVSGSEASVAGAERTPNRHNKKIAGVFILVFSLPLFEDRFVIWRLFKYSSNH